jgi:hypothetical protein
MSVFPLHEIGLIIFGCYGYKTPRTDGVKGPIGIVPVRKIRIEKKKSDHYGLDS